MLRSLSIALAFGLVACASAPSPTAATKAAVQDGALTPANLVAFFDCTRAFGLTLISAHRGGYGPGYPENALETFAHTLTVAPAPVMLEMDVRRSADGVLVLIHDDDLNRTTTGEGKVETKDLAALKSLRLKDETGAETPFAIPTLEEALIWSKGRTVVKLDVKRGVPFAEVVAAVRKAGAEQRAVIITYNPRDAAEVTRLAPELMQSVSADTLAELDALVAAGVRLDHMLAFTGTRRADPSLWAMLEQRGVEPIFGTLGRKGQSLDDQFAADGQYTEYVDLARQGVRIIATNNPQEAARALEQAGLGAGQAQACEASR
jgi:glycerophosphoryl diester phosphodiesterase